MERKELKDVYSYDVRYYKADEADKVLTNAINRIKQLESENRKLRYERQMAKAAYFRNLAMVKDYEARELFDCGCDKSADKKLDDCNKCYDIAAAYEARAKKLKEQK